MKLFYGILFGILGQIGSFLQFQCSYKYGWMEKYMWLILILGMPVTLFYIKSTHNLIMAYDGDLWPSRLIGFGIGVIVFLLMSFFLFKESLSLKTLICLILAVSIISIQIFWKTSE
jgi:multidrug transporter EmrE-like cation transporter